MVQLASALSVLTSSFAATTAQTCSKTFLGFKTWYYYFPNSWFGGSGKGACDINNNFDLLNSSSGASGLTLIALAILEDLIQIAALVAIGFVITGGFKYITSQGSPDATSKAQQTIINALIGLVLAIFASGIVSFIGGKLGG